MSQQSVVELEFSETQIEKVEGHVTPTLFGSWCEIVRTQEQAGELGRGALGVYKKGQNFSLFVLFLQCSPL